MTTHRKRPPDRPLAMGQIGNLAEMLTAYACEQCDFDLTFRPYLDGGLEMRIGHDPDCPRWVAAHQRTA